MQPLNNDPKQDQKPKLDQPALIGLNYALDNLDELLNNPTVRDNRELHEILSKIRENLTESLKTLLPTPPIRQTFNPLDTSTGDGRYNELNRIRDRAYDDGTAKSPDRTEVLVGRGRNGTGIMNWVDENALDDVQRKAEEDR